jgi:hypothetical protein
VLVLAGLHPVGPSGSVIAGQVGPRALCGSRLPCLGRAWRWGLLHDQVTVPPSGGGCGLAGAEFGPGGA